MVSFPDGGASTRVSGVRSHSASQLSPPPMAMEVENGGASRIISADAGDQAVRIFVGGLGESVTDDDLRRMFEAMGSVDEIEIIRSKGRSIAYLNFTPSSAKSLAKLFSSFNGCVWKGGRLRIEKAKEHYLVKMEREREIEREEEIARHDAAMKSAAAAADVVSLKKPTKGPGAEKEQLRIFFPKLRKVKPLPFSGCGKHKYSFRNIPVPSLPIHFCDCELHSVPYDAPIETDGVDEKEFDLMHSVLNKLISKDGNSSVKAEGEAPNENTGPSSISDDIFASDENAPNSEPDEDGIIINISGGMKETDFSWKLEDKKVSEYQGSNDNPSQVLEADDKKLPNANKKSKLGEESNETVCHSLKKKKDDLNTASILPLGSNSLRAKNSKWKELVGEGTDSSFKLSNVLSRGLQESVQQEDNLGESSKSEELDDETEASADESLQDTEEKSSKSEEISVEDEESTDESVKSDTDESDDVVEKESTDELAKQEDTEDESNKSGESDDEAEEGSNDKLGKLEDTEDESDKLDESDDVAEVSSDAVAQQDDTEEKSNKLDQPVTKPGENKQQEGVKLTDAEDGSVKKGATWSQIMPWTQLVSDLDNSSFSISQILPGCSANQVAAKPSPEVKDSSTDQSSEAVKVETTPVSDVDLTSTATDLHERKNLSNSAHHGGEGNSFGATKTEDENSPTRVDSAPKPVVKADTYERRPFVRCEASLKEWANIKKALRKSRTKKRKTPEE